jgi:hypothetical protein
VPPIPVSSLTKPHQSPHHSYGTPRSELVYFAWLHNLTKLWPNSTFGGSIFCIFYWIRYPVENWVCQRDNVERT